jgi:hypothetical protein
VHKNLILLVSFATIILSACSAQTSMTSTSQPESPYEGWNTYDSGDYTFKYPASFYIPVPIGPVFNITDSKTTYDTWAGNTPTNSELFITFISLNLDRRLDPYNNSSLLATPELALKKEINLYFGVPYLVSGITSVPWENANGGTADGRNWFYPNVTYQNIMLGSVKSAKVISDHEIVFFILNPNDDSYYVRFSIKPVNSSLLNVADQILNSFKFSH